MQYVLQRQFALMPFICVPSAIGQGINMDEVKGIANNEDYVFHAADYGQVQDMTDEIASKICSKGKQIANLSSLMTRDVDNDAIGNCRP